MPLQDWKDERGWDGVHLLWLAQLLDWIQPRLPPGLRADVGSVPALPLEASTGKPDVTVRGWRTPPSDSAVMTPHPTPFPRPATPSPSHRGYISADTPILARW